MSDDYTHGDNVANHDYVIDKPRSIHDRVQALMGWKNVKVNLWFNTKNPLLGDVSPVEMIMAGRTERLERFITEAEELANQ